MKHTKKPLMNQGGKALVCTFALVNIVVLFSAARGLMRNAQWVTREPGMITTSPVFIPERTFFNENTTYSNGNVYTINNDTLTVNEKYSGFEKWRFSSINRALLSQRPVVSGGRVYISDAAGGVYAFSEKTGERLWYRNYSLKEGRSAVQLSHKLWTGTLTISSSGSVLYGGLGGAVRSLAASTGKQDWIYEGRVPVVAINQLPLYIAITDESGGVTVLSETGRFLWKAPTTPGAKVVNSLFLQKSHAIQILGKSGTLVSRNLSDGRILYSASLGYLVSEAFFVYSDALYVQSVTDSQALLKVDLRTGKTLWKFPINTKISAPVDVWHRNVLLSGLCDVFQTYIPRANICSNTVFVGDEAGVLWAIDDATGWLAWSFQSTAPIVASPVIHDRHVIFGNLHGDAYTLLVSDGKIPKPAGWRKSSVTLKTPRLLPGDVQEFTMTLINHTFPRPWEDVSVTGRFRNIDTTVSIDGFYFDKNEWRVLFNPPKKGLWNYTLTLRMPDGSEITHTGTFESDSTTEGRFLRAIYVPNSKGLLTQDGKTHFSVLGIQNTVYDRNCDGSPLNDFSIGDRGGVSTDSARLRCSGVDRYYPLREFLREYGDSSHVFNTYRWGVGNAGFQLAPSMYPGGFEPSVHEGKDGDVISRAVYDSNMHLWLTLFGQEVPNQKAWTDSPIYLHIAKQYIRYMVARYGAYVSVWEITNEAYVDDGLIDELATYLKQIDPEKRLISTSWEKPHLSNVDIISPHWYASDSPAESEQNLLSNSYNTTFNTLGKPIVFGEIGNKISNWDTESADRMRIRMWTALMNQIGLIFWNSSENKFYTPTGNPNLNGNLYIGKVERDSVRVVNTFSREISLDSEPFLFEADDVGVRTQALADDAHIRGYFYRPIRSTDARPVTVTFQSAGESTVTWVDPVSGMELKTDLIAGGPSRVTSPPFLTDVAIHIDTIVSK